MRLPFEKSAVGMFVGLALFGCAESVTPFNAQDNAANPIEDRNSDAVRELRQKAFERKAIERVDTQEPAPVTGEVPAIFLQKIYADLESSTGGSPSDFELLRGEAMQWNDSALGCAEPGMMYQQVPMDGYWVVIMYQGKEYDYRASDRGFFKLCPGVPLTRAASPK